METTCSEFGNHESDNVILYPTPNFMQPASGHIKESLGEIRSPPSSRAYRNEETITSENRFSDSGYSREYQQKISRDEFSQDPRIATENYVPSTEAATSSRNYSLSNGLSDSSSAHFNQIYSPSTNSSTQQTTQQRQYLSSGYYLRPNFRETSVREDTGQDGSTEWSRREESIRETGESRSLNLSDRQAGRLVASPALSSQPTQMNGFTPLPPVSTPAATSSASSGFRVTRRPTIVTRNGDSEVVLTEEMKKEDDNSETIIQRRTIRRKRVPLPRMSGRDGDISEGFQRSASYRMQRRTESVENDMQRKPPASVRSRLLSDIGRHGPRHIDVSKTVTATPPRTYSQTNIHQYSNTLRNQWSSENNLQAGSYLKQPPILGTYSAHQENLRRKNEMNQQSETTLTPQDLTSGTASKGFSSHLRSSRRMSETGYGEIYQEIVSLLPIGRGIQDLESSSNAATLPRTGSHTAVDAMSATSKYSIGSSLLRPPPVAAMVTSPTATSANSAMATQFQTQARETVQIRNQLVPSQQQLRSPILPMSLSRPHSTVGDLQPRGRSYSASVGNRGQFYSGTQSPAPSRQPGGRLVSEHRSRTIQNESHWSNYNGLGSSMGSLHGGSYTAGQGQSNHMAMDTIESRRTMSNDMSYSWFRPNATRQEATQMLINKEAGSFIVRTSKSHPDSYALVVRVPLSADDSEPVRTFLLNRVKGGDAVHLRGFESEPIFPSLSAFVQDHTIHQGALPVLLKMPLRNAFSSNYLATGTTSPSLGRHNNAGSDFITDVLYLGSVDVFPLQGESAVRRAVEQVLSQANNPTKGLKKKCEATVMCSVDKGITIFDKNSTRFTKKTILPNKILCCSYDPEQRVFNAIELKNRGVADSQIFAIVAKKTRFTMTEHAAYVMCQLEPHQPSSSLINYINQNLPVHYR